MDELDTPPSAIDARGRLLIHAPNIHQGGGRTLLIALLQALAFSHEWTQVVVTLDKRLKLDESLTSKLTTIRVAPTLLARLHAEWLLSRSARREDLLLCFGNLPPLFAVQSRVLLFLQNHYLIKGVPALELPFKLKARLQIERIWLRRAVHRCNVVIVQSPSMQRRVEEVLGVKAIVAPFVDAASPHRAPSPEKTLDYLYVASGEPHKNHRRLIEAWINLAEQGLFPSLGLTLDPTTHEVLCKWITDKASLHALQIKMLGTLSSEQIERTYLGSKALIFPSLFESFGLPLVEAMAVGIPILASERDYVRDVIEPAESFDPESSVSIARAVLRHMKVPQEAPALMSAQEFHKIILTSHHLTTLASIANK
jgi:glycosyltransferase involved in cell wall biosynthesis